MAEVSGNEEMTSKTQIPARSIRVDCVPAQQNPENLARQVQSRLDDLPKQWPGCRVVDIKYSYSATETPFSSARGWYSAMIILSVSQQ